MSALENVSAALSNIEGRLIHDGRWEQHMRTVRNILSVLLQESGTQLDHESFGTLMKEVQAS